MNAPQTDAAAEIARLTRENEVLRRQLAHSEDVAGFWYGEATRLEQLYRAQRCAAGEQPARDGIEL